jgi:hypothetical protein
MSLNDRDCEVPDSPHPQPLSRKGRGGKSVGMGSVCAPRVACEFSPLSPRGRGTGGEGPSGGADNLTRSFNAPPRIRTSSGSFEGCYAFQHTRRAICRTRIKRKRSTRRLTPSARRVSSHLMPRPGFEPGPGPSDGPNAFRYTIETNHSSTTNRADGWIRTSIILFTRQAPFSVGPRRQLRETTQHEREESNPVRRFWRPPALPGARSCNAHGRTSVGSPSSFEETQLSSGTFQYASLMNFDQLIIRSLVRA